LGCPLLFERVLGGVEVEADAGLGSVSDPCGSELVGVLVYPCTVEVEVLGELCDGQHAQLLTSLVLVLALLLAVQ
jgi:hypothetical protein